MRLWAPPNALWGAHVCTGGSCAPLPWCMARGHLGTAVGERRHVSAPPVLVHGCGSLQGGQKHLQCLSQAHSSREEGLRLSAPAHRRGEILQLSISSSRSRARGVQHSRGLVKA